MTKFVPSACLVAAGMLIASPASAQYRFDRRIDPSVCHWTEICDYGGRAYRAHARPSCPLVEIEDTAPEGGLVIRKVRRCLRVRG